MAGLAEFELRKRLRLLGWVAFFALLVAHSAANTFITDPVLRGEASWSAGLLAGYLACKLFLLGKTIKEQRAGILHKE
jgi:hypothetical protein